MGQSQSSNEKYHASTEELRHELASKFLKRCFTPLELYCFQEVFKSLADHHDGPLSIKEEKLTHFLEIPPAIGVSPIIFQMLSYIGSFPFDQDNPVILGYDQMTIVIVIMTQRYQKILGKDNYQFTKLLFRSLSAHQNYEPSEQNTHLYVSDPILQERHLSSFRTRTTRTRSGLDSEGEDVDEDSLVLSALKLLGSVNNFKSVDISTSQTLIPSDNLRKVLILLVLIAPLGSQDCISSFTDRLVGVSLERLQRTADNILAAFLNVEKSPGVKFHHFFTVISISLPFIFNGFIPLFEHFLFSTSTINIRQCEINAVPFTTYPLEKADQSLPTGDLLDINVYSQLSFFLPSKLPFHKLRLLYKGNEDGFSMGSFETRVFNWRAPTILLVSGTRICEPPISGKERSFVDSLPSRKFPHGNETLNLVYGLYLSQFWRQSHHKCFGDSDTLLFQLEPVHEVFHASHVNNQFIAFNKKSNSYQGITIGCSYPKSERAFGFQKYPDLDAVCLVLDSSFEYGVFTHDFTSNSSTFHHSETRKFNWQDRFQIQNLEVWGCGDDADAELQKKRWEWDKREAEARRRINLGSGDIESDRALLEMAGLINDTRSGGSMN